ncbi:hypothetical protein E2562_025549 [Oryza meyeriana var. granulata]|uniref:Cupin type-1 domain-containing protein n=1 Tax=Oryza meyeriana var. granulata TaxID=110450 RepID=A0A6G1FCF1_9ORYZ|nr:hypothetical protein E2562_025549 [Oryza meyeriana var. granulata]
MALPAGVAHWLYNGGDTPAVVVYVYDIKNYDNQLEPRQKKTKRNGCQYITVKTSPGSMVSWIIGKDSILCALLVDVIANAYRISRDEARHLKNNRVDEIGAFTPRFPRGANGFPYGCPFGITNVGISQRVLLLSLTSLCKSAKETINF